MMRHTMSLMDQSHEPNALMYEILQKLGPERRIQMAFEMSQNLRAISEHGVRRRHPEYTDRQVRLAATKLAIGNDLFKKVYPSEDIEP
jgi:hypothetical protein